MSFVKETVDKLLKGYDIRLRPDFGGTCRVYLRYFSRLRQPALFLAPFAALWSGAEVQAPISNLLFNLFQGPLLQWG